MEEQTARMLTGGRKTYARLGLALLVMTLCSDGAAVLISLIAGVMSESGYELLEAGWFKWIVSFAPLYGIGIPVALLMMKKVPVEPFEQTKLSGKEFFLFLLMCFPLMYGGNLIGNILSALLSGGEAENALLDYISEPSLMSILVMVVLAPLLEELVFRKFLLDRAAPYGEKTAVLFSALTFGLFHMNLFQFFYAFALGWLFAFVYVRTRRLRYSVILHMVINFLGSVLAPWLVSALDLEAMERLSAETLQDPAMIEALPGILAYTAYAVGLVLLSLVGVIVLIVRAKALRLEPDELSKGQRFKMAYCNVGVLLFFLICAAMLALSLFM